VKFSPFLENRLAVSTSENFGIVGTGRQHILDVSISYDGIFWSFWFFILIFGSGQVAGGSFICILY
jgi:hypothetical protein